MAMGVTSTPTATSILEIGWMENVQAGANSSTGPAKYTKACGSTASSWEAIDESRLSKKSFKNHYFDSLS